jgi:hypothetical protein
MNYDSSDHVGGGTGGGSKGIERSVMYKDENCSPGESDVNGSCLDSEMIMILAKAMNKMSPGNPKLKIMDLNKSTEDIHGDICQNISRISSCSSEACWGTIKSLSNEMGSHRSKMPGYFRPMMPDSWRKDYNKWLSTFEIEDVLNQHKSDDSFHFYGAVPMDFKKCSVSNLCSFNLKKHLKAGKTKIGIVFNTDPSTKDGEHWISMYVDLANHNSGNDAIYYFDSYGDKPSKEVAALIKKIKKQGTDIGKNIMYFYNDEPYQKKNSQCGMYAIHFIKQMLEGISFEEYLHSKLSDKMMIRLRDEYFVKL